MAKFFGSCQGGRGEAHRLGHKSIEVVAASWKGAIETRLTEDKDGKVQVSIRRRAWHGQGESAIIYDGPLEGVIVQAQSLTKPATRGE